MNPAIRMMRMVRDTEHIDPPVPAGPLLKEGCDCSYSNSSKLSTSIKEAVNT